MKKKDDSVKRKKIRINLLRNAHFLRFVALRDKTQDFSFGDTYFKTIEQQTSYSQSEYKKLLYAPYCIYTDALWIAIGVAKNGSSTHIQESFSPYFEIFAANVESDRKIDDDGWFELMAYFGPFNDPTLLHKTCERLRCFKNNLKELLACAQSIKHTHWIWHIVPKGLSTNGHLHTFSNSSPALATLTAGKTGKHLMPGEAPEKQ